MGGRRYLVRRQPDQARPKKRGDGETAHSHCAWLFDTTDLPIDEVTADNCGIVLAEKKVGEVGNLIRELLGYSAEQFRQIVLLPQGRFERFLLANSDERVAILRDLFDVSLYRELTRRMKDRAFAAKREFEDGHRVVAQRLAENDFASTDELATGIVRANEAVEASEAQAAAAERLSTAAEKAHAEAEMLEARFTAVEGARRHRSDLEARRGDIDTARLAVDQAEKAQKATDLEVRLTEAEHLLESAVSAETEARDTANDASSEHDISEAAFNAAVERATNVDTLVKRSSELERYRRSLLAAVDLKNALDSKTNNQTSARSAFDTAEAERARLDTLCTDLSDRLESERRDNLTRAELSTRLAALRQEFGAARAYSDASTRLHEATRALETAKDERDRKAALVEPSRGRVVAAERAFIDAQAQMLASTHLVDGHPCPVCGSADHPMPAHGDGDPKQLERDLNEARKHHDAVVRSATIAEGAVAPAEALVSDRTAALSELSAPRAAMAAIEKEGTQIADDLAALGEAVDLASIETELAENRRLLADATSAVTTSRDDLQRSQTAQAVAARSYQDAILGVPEPLREDGAVNAELLKVNQEVKSLRDAVAAADTKRRETAATKASTTQKLTGAAAAVLSARDAVSKARDAFKRRLGEVGLSLEQYRSGLEEIPQISVLRAQVEKFRDDIILADAKIREAETAVENLDRPDLAESAERRDAARADALAARRTTAEVDASRKVLVELRTSLLDQLEHLEKLEQETGPLRALADAFAGDNAMRTPLESFAIGAMFDHVLDAANLRLAPMTAGRYRFERDVESVGGRSKRGLDVRVHDIETGRPREISTLSGGETFIAALSLALGLADIVEMSHGQIRLDTIFIDEGFGSLDTDNDSGTLDLVLQVLQEIVGNRRAVGLISHVPMVQQAVPNGFLVVKAIGGSRIERRAA